MLRLRQICLVAGQREPAVADLGGRCLRVLLVANIPFAVGATLSMALRGAGDVRTPLAIGILGNGVNLVADYALIFGNLEPPSWAPSVPP